MVLWFISIPFQYSTSNRLRGSVVGWSLSWHCEFMSCLEIKFHFVFLFPCQASICVSSICGERKRGRQNEFEHNSKFRFTRSRGVYRWLSQKKNTTSRRRNMKILLRHKNMFFAWDTSECLPLHAAVMEIKRDTTKNFPFTRYRVNQRTLCCARCMGRWRGRRHMRMEIAKWKTTRNFHLFVCFFSLSWMLRGVKLKLNFNSTNEENEMSQKREKSKKN